MRWNTPEKVYTGTRVIKRFLLFPRTINGETRWLEWAEIEQENILYMDCDHWEDVEWITP